MTSNITKRLAEHNDGKVKSTKPYGFWEIVHHEIFETRQQARIREKYLKSATGRRWRKENIRPRGATE